MLQKNETFFVLLWGPLFVGAPVRPNMLNMPKSASAYKVDDDYVMPIQIGGK